jgi:hypothetical protein
VRTYRARSSTVHAIQWRPGVEVPGWHELQVDRSQVFWGVLKNNKTGALITLTDGSWLVFMPDGSINTMPTSEFEAHYLELDS